MDRRGLATTETWPYREREGETRHRVNKREAIWVPDTGGWSSLGTYPRPGPGRVLFLGPDPF